MPVTLARVRARCTPCSGRCLSAAARRKNVTVTLSGGPPCGRRTGFCGTRPVSLPADALAINRYRRTPRGAIGADYSERNLMTDENVTEDSKPTARQLGEAYAARKFGEHPNIVVRDDYTRTYLERQGWL